MDYEPLYTHVAFPPQDNKSVLVCSSPSSLKSCLARVASCFGLFSRSGERQREKVSVLVCIRVVLYQPNPCWPLLYCCIVVCITIICMPVHLPAHILLSWFFFFGDWVWMVALD